MVERETRVGLEGKGVGVEREDVDAVGVLFDEASDGEAVRVGGREGGGVERVWGVVGYGVLVGSEVGILGGIFHFVWGGIGLWKCKAWRGVLKREKER